MPESPNNPGMYVQEIPSGVHPIVGVATSITAFLGRTQRGPVNTATMVSSFAEFENQFGGLDANLPMPYAVRDFYLNGGSQAVIVRLFQAPAAGAEPSESAGARRSSESSSSSGGGGSDSGGSTSHAGRIPGGSSPAATSLGVPIPGGSLATAELASNVNLQAAGPGAWGARLGYAIDYDGIQPDFATGYGLQPADLFNMTVTDAGTGLTERFVNLTLASSPDTPRRIDHVLQSAPSQLVRAATADGGAWPTDLNRPEASQLDAQGRPQLSPLQGGANSTALPPSTYTDALAQVLDTVDLFNLLCIPPDQPGGDTDQSVLQVALEYCVQRRAMLIVDPPAGWGPSRSSDDWLQRLAALGLSGEIARNAAIYYPRVVEADPMRDGLQDTYVPCGIVAGVFASTDTARGVWKTPAGVDASISGIVGVAAPLNDDDAGVLNPLGINALRTLPVYGTVLWGARTLRGADLLADDYKYIQVRRLALYIEESLYRGLKWAVFEPNDEPLWSQIRFNVGAFMNGLFRQGAFQGSTPASAYFVNCDKGTTPQNDLDQGIVNVIVGFAPVRPAEFVIIQIRQAAGKFAA